MSSKKYSSILNVTCIIVGGAMLLYTISSEEKNKYLQIFGLIIIMFGLYRATNHWIETKDDGIDEEGKNKDI